MNTIVLYSKIELLPEHLKKQVLEYIEFLLSREDKGQKAQPPENQKVEIKSGFGGAKGMFIMSPDFDEPLEDFKEYV